MLISVIIPTFNVEEYIKDCQLSVLSQTHQPLEIICIATGSSDRTIQQIEAFVEEFRVDFLRLFHESKRGAPFARNLGLKHARGNWVQFLDADDLLSPTKLESQVSLIQEAENVDFIVATSKYLDNEGTLSYRYPLSNDSWLALVSVELGNTCSNLFWRTAVEAIHGWDVALKSSQEYDLMFKLLRDGARPIFDFEPLTTIRQRRFGSISNGDIIGNTIRRIDHLKQIRIHFQMTKIGADYLKSVNQYLFREILILEKSNPIEAAKIY